MSRGRIKAILFIIVFLLIAAVIASWLTGRDKQNESPAVNEPSGSTEITVIGDEPTPPATHETPTPAASATPIPVPAPTPTPAPDATPTPEPTPTPAATGLSLGSGSFRSDTGTALNLKAEWSAKTVSSTQAEITVTVSVDSYSLYLQAVPQSVHLSVGGQYASLDAPAVSYDGSAATNTVLGSKTFTVDLADGSAADYSVAVEWHFGGTYGGQELDVIECGGTISLAR